MANLETTLAYIRSKNPDAAITQGFLRSDIVLSANVQTLNFNLTVNNPNSGSANLTAKERPFRLKLSDAFCVTAMGIWLYSYPAAAPTDAQFGSSIDYSYPNLTALGAGSTNMEALYNGALTVTINKEQIFTQFPTRYFRKVSTAQLGATTAAIAGPVVYTTPYDEQTGYESGFYPITPTINLQGAWDMQFQLSLPAGYDMTAASRVSYCSLALQGYLLPNCAQYEF